MELRARGDRVVSRLETRDRRDDDIKGNLPGGSVLGRRGNAEVIPSCKLEDLAELEAAVSDDVVVLFLVAVEILQERLSLGGRRELGQYTKNLTASDGADVDVVTEDGDVGRRNGERNLCKRRIEGFNLDDGVLLVVKSKSAEQTLDLHLRIRGPDTDVIAMLVGDAGVLGVKLDVDAVAVSVLGE